MRRPPRHAGSSVGASQPAPALARSVAKGQPAASAALSKDSELAAAIKALVVAGNRDAARERFADLVAHQQRRALRIAYHYLRDAHDADEAVQDAFVKVFTHITTYREELPFEVWFTRILVNGCLDIRKARARRLRWVAADVGADGDGAAAGPGGAAAEPGGAADVQSSGRARSRRRSSSCRIGSGRCSRSATSPSRARAR